MRPLVVASLLVLLWLPAPSVSGVTPAAALDPPGSGAEVAWVWPLSAAPGPGGPPGGPAVLAPSRGGSVRPEVSRGFDPPDTPYGSGHRGVDLAGHPGDKVLASGPGVVTYAAVLAGRGVVAVTHPDGLRTTYEPVQPVVHAGQRVTAGEILGTLLPGHPGCRRDACLHWGLRRDKDYLDPLALLRDGPARLLPLDASAGARPGGRASGTDLFSDGGGLTPGQRSRSVDQPSMPPPRDRQMLVGAGLALIGAVLLAHRRPR